MSKLRANMKQNRDKSKKNKSHLPYQMI